MRYETQVVSILRYGGLLGLILHQAVVANVLGFGMALAGWLAIGVFTIGSMMTVDLPKRGER